jgi:hypothetical protein
MSTLTLVEQTSPSAQSAGQQKVYPKVGAIARMDSTGVEKIIYDSGSSAYLAAVSAISMQQTLGGL